MIPRWIVGEPIHSGYCTMPLVLALVGFPIWHALLLGGYVKEQVSAAAEE